MRELINEVRHDEDRPYQYVEYDKKLKDGTPYSSKQYLPTEEEALSNATNVRIEDLRISISDKKLLDMDCTEEQKQLKKLLKL